MKADNEPAISLPVYFKSVKKGKYVLRNNKKKGNIIFHRRESYSGSLTCKVNALPIAPRHLILNTPVKLIMFYTFAHEILPVDDAV